MGGLSPVYPYFRIVYENRQETAIFGVSETSKLGRPYLTSRQVDTVAWRGPRDFQGDWKMGLRLAVSTLCFALLPLSLGFAQDHRESRVGGRIVFER